MQQWIATLSRAHASFAGDVAYAKKAWNRMHDKQIEEVKEEEKVFIDNYMSFLRGQIRSIARSRGR